MSRNRIILTLVAAFHLSAVVSWGCAICMGVVPQKPTLADEVSVAHEVVVATALTEAGTFEVHAVIKGDAALKGVRVKAPSIDGKGTLILSRAAVDAPWSSLGESGIQFAGFFKAILDLPAAETVTEAQWNERLSAFRPFLGHPDPRIARSAWAAWARAPYRVLKTQRLEAENLRAWLADPAQAYAQPMWIVLLGASGDADDARKANEQLEAAWKANDASLLAALLTARIEREGDEGVAWLEVHYLRDRDRTLEEIQAAVAALGVQGEASDRLRPRILAACRVFLAERRPLSGLVARDLAAWRDWSAAAHYQTLLASGEPVLPETRGRIQEYLKACRAAANKP
ncbi:MAG: hypothetical protein DVB22_000092 [Verrucomicrobia bacterium]|nr:MAG: hypothetical protein DVB22_000092 [Verrucomicrobiota bacterium]